MGRMMIREIRKEIAAEHGTDYARQCKIEFGRDGYYQVNGERYYPSWWFDDLDAKIMESMARIAEEEKEQEAK